MPKRSARKPDKQLDLPAPAPPASPHLATSPWACTARGIDLQLTQYDDRGWRATQRAAWEALSKGEDR